MERCCAMGWEGLEVSEDSPAGGRRLVGVPNVRHFPQVIVNRDVTESPMVGLAEREQG